MPSSRAPRPRPSPAPRPYHHGDLHQALLEAALRLLRDGGPEALTLRAVARAAGVSQTAPYRHFTDRRALVAGVAQQAFARMGTAIGRAVQRGGDGPSAFRRGMAAYVRFARDNPAEYRVMFGAELGRQEDLPALRDAALGVFGALRGGIERLQQRGDIGPGEPGTLAITAWATLHGLVMLALDGQTSVTGRSVDTLVDSATDLLLVGMGATRRQAGRENQSVTR